MTAQLATGRLALIAGSAQVHADAPEKARDPGPTMGRPGAAMQGVLDAMAGARREVGIMSPYFVPGPVGMRAMSAGVQQGVRITLFTNSLASSDEPLVHHRYAGYRVALLRLGVQIYEFSPELIQRSRGFGFRAPSSARLHAKVAVVDDRLLVVGSVNLDPRSAIANTETSVVIDSPPLVAELLRLSEEQGTARDDVPLEATARRPHHRMARPRRTRPGGDDDRRTRQQPLAATEVVAAVAARRRAAAVADAAASVERSDADHRVEDPPGRDQHGHGDDDGQRDGMVAAHRGCPSVSVAVVHVGHMQKCIMQWFVLMAASSIRMTD